MKVIEYIELKLDESFRFIPMTKKYGRAEFVICPIIKYGKIKEIYITALQQPDGKNYHLVINDAYKIDTIKVNDFTNSSRPPNMWRSVWCKTHKTFANVWYVPSKANTVTFREHFGHTIGLYFERGGKST